MTDPILMGQRSESQRAARREVSPDLLRQLLDYDPETGVLTWRARTPDMFKDGNIGRSANCSAWNSRYAGTVAGSPDYEGYILISILGKTYRASRVSFAIVNGYWPKDEIDHKDCASSDDRFCNLREATRAQNASNRRTPKNNTSGYKGVTFHKHHRKYLAQIGHRGLNIYLGLFDAAEEAAERRAEESARLHGEFART